MEYTLEERQATIVVGLYLLPRLFCITTTGRTFPCSEPFAKEELYKKIKYCDNNPNFMILIKNGYSSGLANILLKKYLHYLQFDISNETVVISDSILNKMIEDDINGIYISELKRLI